MSWLSGLVSFSALLLLYLSALLFRHRSSMVVLFLHLALTVVLAIDLVYYRLFQDYPTVGSLLAVGQLPKGPDAVWVGMGWSDLSLWADLPLLGLLYWKNRDSARTPSWSFKLGGLSFGTLALGASALLLLLPQLAPNSNYLRRFRNKGIANYSGLVFYHIYDSFYYLHMKTSLGEIDTLHSVQQKLQERRETSQSSPYFGLHRGRNLIFIQLESFESFVLGLTVEGQEVTPHLNRLKETSLWAGLVDQTDHGGTSDGEFLYLNSLYPPTFGPHAFHFASNHYRSLPRLLTGYQSLKAMPYDGNFWNARTLDRQAGFQYQEYAKAFRIEKEDYLGWGIRDDALFPQVSERLETLDPPFFYYLATVMNHYPFAALRPEQRLLKLSPELEQSMAGRYLQLAAFRDQALGDFLSQLKDKQLWDNSLLVLVGDHRSRLPRAEKKRLGLETWGPLSDRVFFLLHSPNNTPRGQVSEPMGQLDVMPTLLHLLGLESQESLALGRQVFSESFRPVVTPRHVLGREFIWERGRSGVFSLEAQEWQSVPEIEESYRRLFEEEHRLSDSVIYGNLSEKLWELQEFER